LLRGKDVQELKDLQGQGMSIQAISKLTGWDRKTIRKYMQAAGLAPEYGPRSTSPSKLDCVQAIFGTKSSFTVLLTPVENLVGVDPMPSRYPSYRRTGL